MAADESRIQEGKKENKGHKTPKKIRFLMRKKMSIYKNIMKSN